MGTKVLSMPNDELVKTYVSFRERRRERKKLDDLDKEKMEKIEGMLLERFRAEGLESIRTVHGTAYKQMRSYAKVSDRDIFMNNVITTGAYELMDVRCSKESVAQFKAEHGELPPGVGWSEEVHINVRKE